MKGTSRKRTRSETTQHNDRNNNNTDERDHDNTTATITSLNSNAGSHPDGNFTTDNSTYDMNENRLETLHQEITDLANKNETTTHTHLNTLNHADNEVMHNNIHPMEGNNTLDLDIITHNETNERVNAETEEEEEEEMHFRSDNLFNSYRRLLNGITLDDDEEIEQEDWNDYQGEYFDDSFENEDMYDEYYGYNYDEDDEDYSDSELSPSHSQSDLFQINESSPSNYKLLMSSDSKGYSNEMELESDFSFALLRPFWSKKIIPKNENDEHHLTDCEEEFDDYIKKRNLDDYNNNLINTQTDFEPNDITIPPFPLVDLRKKIAELLIRLNKSPSSTPSTSSSGKRRPQFVCTANNYPLQFINSTSCASHFQCACVMTATTTEWLQLYEFGVNTRVRMYPPLLMHGDEMHEAEFEHWDLDSLKILDPKTSPQLATAFPYSKYFYTMVRHYFSLFFDFVLKGLLINVV